MKKLIPLLLSLAFVLTLIGCTSEDKATFQATILEIQDGYYLVEPAEGSTELNSADQITVPMVNINPSQEPEVGDTVEIVYDGAIAESYPAQMLMCHKVTHKNLIDSSPLFHCYSTIWLEKTTLIQYNRVSGRYLYEENIYR